MADDHDYGMIGPEEWAQLSAGDSAYLRAGAPDNILNLMLLPEPSTGA